MDIRTMFTKNKTTPAPALSERERIAAELEYENSQLPELKMLVRFGRRPQEAVDEKEHLIADLETRLDALTKQENIERERGASRVEKLPKAEATYAAKLAVFAQQLGSIHHAARELRAMHDDMMEEFADLKDRQRGISRIPGLRNRPAFTLGGSTFLDQLVGEYESLSIFISEAREAGINTPALSVPSAAAARSHRPRKAEADKVVDAQLVQDARQAIERDRIARMRNAPKVAA
jgi:hypothetical protein